MKKIVFVLLTALYVSVSLMSCKDKGENPKTEVNYVTDVATPMGNYLSFNFPLDEFKKLGQKGDSLGQLKLIEEYRPQLTANAMKYKPCVKDPSKIKFRVYKKGYAKNVESKDGKNYSSPIENQLMVIYQDSCVGKKNKYFLTCSNGMMEEVEGYLGFDAGSGSQMIYEIKRGEGLETHFDELEKAYSVAKDLKIPIKNGDGKYVTYETYRKVRGKYISNFFEGDMINLVTGKVTNKAGQEVDYERRRIETTKANAKIAAEVAAKKAAEAKRKAAEAKMKKANAKHKGKKN